MKKSLLALFVCAFISCQSGSKSDVNQSDSTLAVLSSDTTLSAVNVAPEEAWTVDSFVDEFGESEGDKYVQTTTNGSFSNSATSNSYLMVKLLVTRKNAGIFLHEYRDNEPAQKFIGTGKIRLKNQEGKDVTVYSFSAWGQEGGLLIDGDNYKKFKDFILNSTGTIKAVIYDDYSSVYNLSFDVSGFSNHYNELKSTASNKK